MPIMPVIQPLISSVIRSVIAAANRLRWAYNFDGVDDRGALQFRAINPDGDIDIEWRSGSTVSIDVSRTILSQCISNNGTAQEFFAFVSSNGNLTVRVGGAARSNFPAIVYQPNTKYRWRLVGTTVSFWINDVQQPDMSFTRGAAREPSAQTVIGSAVNSFYYQGVLYDLKINGTLWPMADRNQPIQLPSPSGLGVELITQSVLENPFVKGSQWTYLGGGRWQLIGDGNVNTLEFFAASGANQPTAGHLEFEIESISGTLTCVVSASGTDSPATFNTTGLKRYYYTKQGNTGNPTNGNLIQFKRLSGVVTCVIKNISFKPLGTCNPLTLVNTTSDRWQEVNQ